MSDFELKSTRDGVGEALVELGEKSPDVVVLTADLAESTRVLKFAEEFPERFFECGVSEQNMMGVAAGLSLEGKIPFIASFSVFSPGRNWDQLRVSVCYSNANVKIVGSHAGFSADRDGATHQALEDIAITRVLPNLMVLVPIDYIQTRKAVLASVEVSGPVYIRVQRNESPVVTSEEDSFEIGKAQILKHGRDVTLIGAGPILAKITGEIEETQGIGDVEIVNLNTIKPIDAEAIVSSVRKTGCCLTLEEHQVNGGVGSAVAEVLSKNCPAPLEMIGVNDTFGESGGYEELLEKYGLGIKTVSEAIKRVIKRKEFSI
jgi:transketolase